MHGRIKGLAAGGALALGVVSGGFWADLGSTTVDHADASACHTIFAGRSGTFNSCQRIPDDQVAKNIKQGVGTTITGCALGIAGGPAAIVYGCLGGLASNIPWNGWPNAQ